jgi:hypothetical protein
VNAALGRFLALILDPGLADASVNEKREGREKSPARPHCLQHTGNSSNRFQTLLVLVIDADCCAEVGAKIVVALD